MHSIWNAPSDRDYYDQSAQQPEEEDDDRCFDCGALGDEACMESCATQQLATQNALEELNFAGLEQDKCTFCGDVRPPLDAWGHCKVCVDGMERTKGD